MGKREDDDILHQMSQLALGRDPYGNPVDRDTRMLALDRYLSLRGQIETSQLESSKQQSQERMQAEELAAATKQRNEELELEREKLRIEAEKVEAQKAELAVRALEAVLRAPPESVGELGGIVRALGERLVGPRLIEAKSEKPS